MWQGTRLKTTRHTCALTVLHDGNGAVQVLVGFADKLRLMNVLMDDLKVIKEVSPAIMAMMGDGGSNILVVDDLVDTGKTARVIREMLPKAHFATIYARKYSTEND